MPVHQRVDDAPVGERQVGIGVQRVSVELDVAGERDARAIGRVAEGADAAVDIGYLAQRTGSWLDLPQLCAAGMR